MQINPTLYFGESPEIVKLTLERNGVLFSNYSFFQKGNYLTIKPARITDAILEFFENELETRIKSEISSTHKGGYFTKGVNPNLIPYREIINLTIKDIPLIFTGDDYNGSPAYIIAVNLKKRLKRTFDELDIFNNLLSVDSNAQTYNFLTETK